MKRLRVCSRMSDNDLITMEAAAKAAPVPVTALTVWRWARNGTKSRGGRRVYLKTVRVGQRLFTTRADIGRYLEDLAAADMEHFQSRNPDPAPATAKAKAKRDTAARRDHQKAAAWKRLQSAGIVKPAGGPGASGKTVASG